MPIKKRQKLKTLQNKTHLRKTLQKRTHHQVEERIMMQKPNVVLHWQFGMAVMVGVLERLDAIT
jgi:hypothetical protein